MLEWFLYSDQFSLILTTFRLKQIVVVVLSLNVQRYYTCDYFFVKLMGSKISHIGRQTISFPKIGY